MLNKLYQIFKNSPIISTDTRNIIPGSIFFALKGENFNGNEFANKALDCGASLAVVDDPEIPASEGLFKVTNVLKTLQQLAALHRGQLTIPVIGITGTNGKTTTKELIKSVLSEKFQTFATSGNLNNHIGVPLSILSITPKHEMAVIEMGANHPGEIAELCQIAQPDFGIITNIGKAHLEGFGSFEGVIKTKTELFDFIEEHKGHLFVNGDDQLLMEKSSRIDRTLYGNTDDSLIGGIVKSKHPFLSIELKIDEDCQTLETNLVGSYNLSNLLVAACIGNYFGVEPDKIGHGLSSYKPKNHRSQWLETSSNCMVLDAYNANPSSMKLAIENFVELPLSPKAVILGDMLELGEVAESEHQIIIDLIQNQGFDKIILVGKIFMKLAISNPQIDTFVNTDEAGKAIKQMKLQGYTLLIKGSRGIKLEKLLEVL